MAAGSVLNFDLEAYVSPRRARLEQQLDRYLQARDPEQLWESMRYSVLSGGKRFRAMLCIAAAEAIAASSGNVSQAFEAALPCACAIEMIHAMSLIHDDLPCMDNDDFRRGKPTNHKVFGEAMALLAGDALLVEATQIVLRETPASVDKSLLIDVTAEMQRATGPDGMVGGQVSDSIATGLIPGGAAGTAELLESIHKRKTGALLRFSVWSGARLLGANDQVLSSFGQYGEVLGLAFQIADDLLDLTGDFQSLGKTPGKDEASGKLTWVSVYGIDGSRAALNDLEKRGKSLLTESGLSETAVAPFHALLAYAINRKS